MVMIGLVALTERSQLAPVAQQQQNRLRLGLTDAGRRDLKLYGMAVPVLEVEVPAPAMAAEQGFFGEVDQLWPLIGEQAGAGVMDNGLAVCTGHSAHGAVGRQDQILAGVDQ